MLGRLWQTTHTIERDYLNVRTEIVDALREVPAFPLW